MCSVVAKDRNEKSSNQAEQWQGTRSWKSNAGGQSGRFLETAMLRSEQLITFDRETWCPWNEAADNTQPARRDFGSKRGDG